MRSSVAPCVDMPRKRFPSGKEALGAYILVGENSVQRMARGKSSPIEVLVHLPDLTARLNG